MGTGLRARRKARHKPELKEEWKQAKAIIKIENESFRDAKGGGRRVTCGIADYRMEGMGNNKLLLLSHQELYFSSKENLKIQIIKVKKKLTNITDFLLVYKLSIQ